MVRKLRDIASLPPGWWGPRSKAVSPKAIGFVRSALPRLAGSVPVSIAPVSDGTLMLEWSWNGSEFTAEIHDERMTLTIDNPNLDIYVDRQLEASTAALVDFYLSTAPTDGR